MNFSRVHLTSSRKTFFVRTLDKLRGVWLSPPTQPAILLSPDLFASPRSDSPLRLLEALFPVGIGGVHLDAPAGSDIGPARLLFFQCAPPSYGASAF